MVVQLGNEGITTIDNLVDFEKYIIQQVEDSLRRLGGRIPDPTPNAALGATIPTPPFVFGAKSQKQLLAACDIVKYYETTGQGITTSNISWDMVINNFEAQWKALKKLKKKETSQTPPISSMTCQ